MPRGAQPHTLSIKGSGSTLDGARLLRLISLSNYNVDVEREWADSLLGGVRVLEVEECNLDTAPGSLPAVLLASCPHLSTLRVLAYPKHWSAVNDPPLLGPDGVSDSELDSSDEEGIDDLLSIKIDEVIDCYCMRGCLICSVLKVLGGTVRRVECLSHEVGAYLHIPLLETQVPHLVFPHLRSIMMNHANFEDVSYIVRRLPTLSLLEVDCLHEMPKVEGDCVYTGCCDSGPDVLILLDELIHLLDAADRLEVVVHEFSLLNTWCPACSVRLGDALAPHMQSQGAHLLKRVTSLKLLNFYVREIDMPMLSVLMPRVRQMQIAFNALVEPLQSFPSFLCSTFWSHYRLSRLDIFVSEMSNLTLEIAGAVTEAGHEFIHRLQFTNHTADFPRPLWISVHFVVPSYKLSGQPRTLSLELLQGMAAILQCWVDEEVELFGQKLVWMHWMLSVHGKGRPEEPAVSMCS